MEILCKKCKKSFEKREIIATYDGLYCDGCLPEDVSKRFFTISISWAGVNAIIDKIDDNVNVDQLMMLDKIKTKLEAKILEAIREILDDEEVP